MQDNSQNINGIRLEALLEAMQEKLSQVNEELVTLGAFLKSKNFVDFGEAKQHCSFIKLVVSEFSKLEEQAKLLVAEQCLSEPSQQILLIEKLKNEMSDLHKEFQSQEKEIIAFDKQQQEFRVISQKLVKKSFLYTSHLVSIQEIIEKHTNSDLTMLARAEESFLDASKELADIVRSFQSVVNKIGKNHGGLSNPIIDPQEMNNLIDVIGQNAIVKYQVNQMLQPYNRKIQLFKKSLNEKKPIKPTGKKNNNERNNAKANKANKKK